MSIWAPILTKKRHKLLGIWVSDAISLEERNAVRLVQLMRLVVSQYTSQGMFNHYHASKLCSVIKNRAFRTVRNNVDNNGGYFIMFDKSSDAAEKELQGKPFVELKIEDATEKPPKTWWRL